MCGIAGFVSARDFGSGVLVAMTGALAHRGPDAEGFFEKGPVHLGHRRLSVIDIEGSLQPMSTADGAVTVVYNGEIYNFAALREELARTGYVFRTRGDTEVLLAGWRAWQERLPEKLQGMFAFALWDERDQTLFIARDHVGVKPLYYAFDGETLAFGSELKALYAHPAVTRDLDLSALKLYLESQFIPAPRSIVRDVRKLPPAHALTVRHGKLRLQRYWRLDYKSKLEVDDAESIVATETALRASVKSMLVADVPLGAFVSGGVDSSVVAALMTDLTGRPVETFNVGFEGGVEESEHREAARVAAHLKSHHHNLMLAPEHLLDAFDRWTDVFDEPFADPAALPTMLLAHLARQRVTVVLTGEGADEVFAGYGNYRKRIAEERITRVLGHRYSPIPALVRRLPAAARKDRLMRSIGEPLPRRYRTIPNVFDAVTLPRFVSDAFLEATAGSEDIGTHAAQAYADSNSASYLDRLLHVDMNLWLPDDLLAKVDRATMAHSLEARVPYLDHRFLEFCARLPAAQKLRGRVHKHVLKAIALKYLPADIVHRGKHGFVLPLSDWLAGRLAPEVDAHVLGDGLASRGLFRDGVLERLVGEHRSGRRNHAQRLWALIVLERWFARHAPTWRLAS